MKISLLDADKTIRSASDAAKRIKTVLRKCLKVKFIKELIVNDLLGGVSMPIAFVLINAEIGSEADVLKELRKVEGVEEAYSVYGVYDVIAKVKMPIFEHQSMGNGRIP